jgi:ribosomal protein S18 acetylase RimI-like enzyme
MTSIAWTLRPATPDDRDFVVETNRAAMGPYLEAAFGWDETEVNAYLDEHFDASGGQVIQVDGVDVGELLVDERPEAITLVRIALLPEWQGRGIGSAIVRMLGERARAEDRALVLRVFKSNPRAARLYESLGFVQTGESETDVLMRLDPTI